MVGPQIRSYDDIQGVGLGRAEEDPWKKSCILTLDGGGIRGYASLCMLKVLMDEIQKIEKSYSESHESSFWPHDEDLSHANGAVSQDMSHNNLESSYLLKSPATDTSFSSRRTGTGGLFRRQRRETSDKEIKPNRCGSGKRQNFLPCHYFDYIGGTSTGGLNAIMLGRLRMDVDECLQRYPELANSIFGEGKKRSIFTRVATLSSNKYDSVQLENAIKDIVQIGKPEEMPRQKRFAFNQYHSPEDLCRTVVVANEDNDVGGAPYLFRTYNHDGRATDVKNPGPAHMHEIWQVARATSAAPTFFDPIQIGEKEYYDGGVGHNNPIQLMVEEVTHKNGAEKITDAIRVILSIGTGQKPTRILKVKHKFPRVSQLKPIKKISKLLKSLKDRAVDVEKDHLAFQTTTKNLGFEHYYRWSGGEAVGGLKMDEWHVKSKRGKPTTAEFIKENIKDYMEDEDKKKEVHRLAVELVEARRARIKTPEKIRRFTYCTLVRCPYCDPEEWLETRDVLKEHIQTIHPETRNEKVDLDELVKTMKFKQPACYGGPF